MKSGIIFVLAIFFLILFIPLINSSISIYQLSDSHQNIDMWAYIIEDVNVNSQQCSTPPSDIALSCAERVGDINTWYDVTTNINLDSSDNLRVFGDSPYSEIFKVNATITGNIADITLLNWTFEGNPDNFQNITLFLWNWNENSWGTNCTAPITGSTDVTRNCIVDSNIANYINSSTKEVALLGMSGSYGIDGDLYVDYVKLEVTFSEFTVNSPSDNSNILNNLSTQLNVSTASYTNATWYSWNNLKNYTLCTNSGNCESSITFPRQGYYNLTVWANDSNNNIASKKISIFVGNETKLNNTYNLGDVDYEDSSLLKGFQIKWNITDYENQNLTLHNSSLCLYQISNTADNDAVYWRVDNQTWNENINFNNEITSMPLTNQTNSTWDISTINNYSCLDVKNAVKTDFTSNNYTTIRVEDFDYLITSITDVFDSIILFIGNYVSNFYKIFNSREATSNKPYLNITYYSNNKNSTITNTLSNNSNFTTSTINFTFNITDDNDYLKNISIIFDDVINLTLTNVLINNSINNSYNFSIEGIGEGSHTWYIESYDSDDAVSTSGKFTVNRDTTPPVIDIIYPPDYQSFTYTSGININFTRSDVTTSVDSCWWSNSSGASNYTLASGENITTGESGDGTYTGNVWCNDTLNNIGSDTIHYVISTTTPAVSIDYPPNAQWFNNGTNINFNVTATDDNGIANCSLWGNWTGSWSLNQTNSTPITSGVEYSFTQNISEGLYKFNFNCFDTTGLGSWGSSNFTFGVDETKPNINITQPRNITYTTTSLEINFTRNDTNLGSCWYTTNGGTTNTTIPSCNNITKTFSQGSTTLTIYVNDSANNINSSNITFFVDSINPSVTINTSFSNGSFLNYNTSIEINLTISDTNLETCWNNDNQGTNTTFTCGNNLSLNLSESLHTIYIYANDTLNNLNNSQKISFTPDVTPPNITINLVTPTSGSQNINFNSTEQDTNLDSCWYAIFDSDGNYDVSGGVNNTNVSYICGVGLSHKATVSDFGTYNLTIYSKDSAGNLNSSTESFTTTAPVSVITGGGGAIFIFGKKSEPATNFSILTTNFMDKIDISLPKDSVKPRTKEFIIINRGIEPIDVQIICDTTLINETQDINMCDYVKIPITNFNVSPNEQEFSVGRFEVYSPENSSFGDKYYFNLLAIQTINNETVRYSKLSVGSRISIFATLLKWSSLALGTQSIVDGVEEPREIIFPVTPISLIFSLIVSIIMFIVFFRIDFKLTGFFLSVLTFGSLFFLFLFVL